MNQANQNFPFKFLQTIIPFLIASIVVLFFALIFSCNKPPEHIISENNYDSLQLAPYVEPNFPFITTSIDLRNLGNGLPEMNLTSRGVIMRLGGDAYACFDTDLLRWSVGWTGEFISLTGMAQISYDDFFNKRNKFPTVLGDPKLATGIYPGWTANKADYNDPRFKEPPYDKNIWGPIPSSLGHWEGIELEDSNSLSLHYSVGGTKIRELPGQKSFGNESVFIRTFEINPHRNTLFVNLAEVTNGVKMESSDSWAYIIQGEKQDSVTAVSMLPGYGAQWHFSENRYLSLEYQPTDIGIHSKILIWKGPIEKLEDFKEFVRSENHNEYHYEKKDNIRRWPEKVYTREIKSPDTAAYVTDQLLLPVPNPWHRNVRIMDMDFFSDGRGAAVSFSGDVWLVDGIGSDYMTWSRYASGLNQPMSIQILRDTIYVFDRLGITRFHDYNGDGEADFHENFFNIADQSMETREWPADLVKDPKGGFYIAKGGSLVGGPHIGDPTDKGFNRGSQYDGTVIHVSEDGRSMEVIATGLRGPYLGIHPETGFLTSTDQQGNYVPSTPVYHVQKGDYFGVPSTAHLADTPAITPPLLWIPHNIDPSSLGELWVMSDKMGPLNNQLVHISFARPGLYKILIDTTEQTLQGGLSYIPAHYPTPVSKGAMRKKDGYPYFTGFNLWGSSSMGISSMLRLRYTGKPDLLPVRFKAGRQGIVLRFDVELDAEKVANIGNFQVKRYNYERTPEYGSGHYRLDGSPGEEHLPVLATHLSEDKKSVLLVIPNMTPVEQMEVNYNIRSNDQDTLKSVFPFTVHEVNNLDLEKAGFANVETGNLTMNTEDLQAGKKNQVASVELGEQLFSKMACIGCHSPGTRTDGLYGPPFKDLYGSVQEFNDGSSLKVDDAYLRESILEPNKKVVKDYEAEMPSFLGILNDTEIESVILYIKSLSS